MIAVDSSALIAILRGEPEADRFLRIIAGSSGCLLSAASLLETSMMLAARHRETTPWLRLNSLIADAGMQVIAFDAILAETARQAFLRYGKGRHPAALNFGDCASYALAKHHDVPLLCKGNDFSQTDVQIAGL